MVNVPIYEIGNSSQAHSCGCTKTGAGNELSALQSSPFSVYWPCTSGVQTEVESLSEWGPDILTIYNRNCRILTTQDSTYNSRLQGRSLAKSLHKVVSTPENFFFCFSWEHLNSVSQQISITQYNLTNCSHYVTIRSSEWIYKCKFAPLYQHLPTSTPFPPWSPGNLHSILCFYEYAILGHFVFCFCWILNVIDIFQDFPFSLWLILLGIMATKFIPNITNNRPLLFFEAEKYSIVCVYIHSIVCVCIHTMECIYNIFFIHSITDEHLDCCITWILLIILIMLQWT